MMILGALLSTNVQPTRGLGLKFVFHDLSVRLHGNVYRRVSQVETLQRSKVSGHPLAQQMLVYATCPSWLACVQTKLGQEGWFFRSLPQSV